jgi:hypothetical protein
MQLTLDAPAGQEGMLGSSSHWQQTNVIRWPTVCMHSKPNLDVFSSTIAPKPSLKAKQVAEQSLYFPTYNISGWHPPKNANEEPEEVTTQQQHVLEGAQSSQLA